MSRCIACMEEISKDSKFCPCCGWDSTQVPEQDRNLPANTLLNDRYLIGKVLGSGGFGITYIAYDEQLGRKVAIKEFFPSDFATRQPGSTQLSVFTGDSSTFFDKAKASFLDEAKSLATFDRQDNIVAIYDSFEDNNTAYIIMEYLEGQTLKELLKKQRTLTYPDALTLIIPVLDALISVHSAGIIHRDVAPDNIFIRKDGSVALIDFGAARDYSAAAKKSMTVVLKPGYAPVEQYHSKGSQGPWTDVYSLAATIYRMITGLSPEESIQRAFGDTLKLPSELGVDMPQISEKALMSALAIEPTDRIQSPVEFKSGLLGQPFVAPEKKDSPKSFTPLDERLRKTENSAKRGRHRTVVIAAIAVVCLAAIGVGAFFVLNPIGAETNDQENEGLSNVLPNNPQDAKNQQAPESVEKSEGPPPQVDWEASYEEVLNLYRNVDSSLINESYGTEEDGLLNYAFLYWLENYGGDSHSLDDLQYSYRDLNGDSVPELLVGYRSEYNGDYISDIYTIDSAGNAIVIIRNPSQLKSSLSVYEHAGQILICYSPGTGKGNLYCYLEGDRVIEVLELELTGHEPRLYFINGAQASGEEFEATRNEYEQNPITDFDWMKLR